ncbi:hypothetical protein, partial [Paenibacillus sp. GCM10023250]|uniref:hypothetical protein n=1 Tax=Paenibacillus sp. GCM10023250 TaxID=3252648 RepID=UPI0036121DF7
MAMKKMTTWMRQAFLNRDGMTAEEGNNRSGMTAEDGNNRSGLKDEGRAKTSPGEDHAAEGRGIWASRSSLRQRLLADRRRKLGGQPLMMLVPVAAADAERERLRDEQRRAAAAEARRREAEARQRDEPWRPAEADRPQRAVA